MMYLITRLGANPHVLTVTQTSSYTCYWAHRVTLKWDAGKLLSVGKLYQGLYMQKVA